MFLYQFKSPALGGQSVPAVAASNATEPASDGEPSPEAKLIERLQNERDLYRSLLQVSEAEDAKEGLADALALATRTLGADQAYLEIFAKGSAEAAAQIHLGLHGVKLDQAKRRVSQGIVSDALAEGRMVHTPSALLDDRYSNRESVQESDLQSVVCLPIGDPVLGVLYLAGAPQASGFAQDDLQLVQILAAHLAPLAKRAREVRLDQGDATASWRERLRKCDLVGRSPALASVLQKVSIVAPLDVTVLLTGASGTGKSHVARLVHDNSKRQDGPFVHLNCANFSEQLLESELFGAVKGAHSTANADREGKIASAAGGTLFLDEVAELSPNCQAKLLTFLQSGKFFRVGSNEEESADVRIMAATNRDLIELSGDKSFREDLYYRLNVFPVRLPALAERREDIIPLADYFLDIFADENDVAQLKLSPSAAASLENESWAGNIRELQNVVTRACVMAMGHDACQIEPSHFGEVENVEEQAPTYHQQMKSFQKALLLRALEEADGNATLVSDRLKIARSHVYSLMKTFKLSK